MTATLIKGDNYLEMRQHRDIERFQVLIFKTEKIYNVCRII